MAYIYTFHSHFYAIRFQRKIKEQSITGILMPVPRKVSSSCGSCVKIEGEIDAKALIDDGVEKVFLIEDVNLTLVYEED